MTRGFSFPQLPNLSIIPMRAVGDSRLTPADVRVLCAIGIHTDRAGEGAWASAATLCAEAAISRNQFFRSTAQLLACGYILREPRPGYTSVYSIVLQGHGIAKGVPQTGTGGVPELGTGGVPQTGTQTSPVTSPSNATTTTAREELLSHVPNRPRWEAELSAMESGMGGHHPATTEQIEQAAVEYVANTDFRQQPPNIRRFVHYVKVVQEPAFTPHRHATPETFRAGLEAWAKETD